MDRKTIEARNSKLLALYYQGGKAKHLAAFFNLTVGRIYQILRAYGKSKR